MESSINKEWLDEIRRRTQEALSQAKRDKLRTQYGMEFEYTDSALSPELENEWLDHVLEFERQFEQVAAQSLYWLGRGANIIAERFTGFIVSQ